MTEPSKTSPTTLREKRKLARRGCMLSCAVVSLINAIPLVILVSLYILWAINQPSSGPLARMYRAETDLTALARAVEAYKTETGTYPPEGEEGLRLAADALSAHAAYFGEGPLPDPWGHGYQYVPHTAYDTSPRSLQSEEGYYQPETFQLYCLGADGRSGKDAAADREDNILHWDDRKPWRHVYQEMQSVYSDEHGQEE